MRKFLMKYSEYISVIGFFLINSIFVLFFKYNLLIMNLIYVIALCIEKYLLYLPIDKSINNSFKTCNFNDSINLINEYLPFMSDLFKNMYSFDLLLFENLVKPTKESIVKYIELLEQVPNSYNKIGNTSEVYFSCLLINDKENAKIILEKIMLMIEKKKNKITIFRKNRFIVLESIFDKKINEVEEGIFKYYVPCFDTDNEYQKTRTKFLLGIYYDKRKDYEKKKENFEYVLNHGNNIYLSRLASEYLKKDKLK